MQDREIQLVQDSFAQVVPIADTAAEIFYARLFEIAPEVRPMFKGDMAGQGKKLMATLAVVVNGLRDLDKIVPVAKGLAVRHVGYGVEAAHYEPVGEALLFTLEKGLGDDFTPDVRSAWAGAYSLLSGVMIEAAYPRPLVDDVVASRALPGAEKPWWKFWG
ncbi:globin family protein [Poseidonocella sedimentorum]|uniref:Nitric oxide dioxygenase n=1 Tax=Poseidonocella sedimentorum TaxID=871652 RepID=A0A1I6CU66_9RHOB|nr:globin family protein [Poseidonocella sedimentorum]SFQ96716.1 nitric oxide dioxygenase [Poseidonocella sedimentorum]